jgi:hypothetical protein
VLACTLLMGVSRASAEDIVDPEDPTAASRTPAPVPETAAPTGWIGDPEAPGGWIGDPEAPGGWIGDPEAPAGPDPSTGPVTPAPAVSAGNAFRPELTSWRARYGSSAQTDLQRQGSGEDTFELLNEVSLGLSARISPRWNVTVDGRLSWWMTSGYAGESSPRITSPDDWQGRFEGVLRDCHLSGRAGSWIFKFGNQLVSWGSMDLMSPADVVAPRDLRRGIFADGEESRVAMPAANATWLADRLAWQFLLIPFFVPNQQALYGSDFAPLRQGSPLQEQLPVDLLINGVDPSIEDDLNGALRQTRRPEELLRNLQPASRLTSSWGGMDLSAGYLYGFDRVPTLQVADSLVQFGRFAAGRDEPLSLDAATLVAIGPLLEDLESGATLIDTGYERTHFVTVDGVRYLGPVGLRWEGAWSPSRTAYVEGPGSLRRAWASGAAGLSYESEDTIVVTAEVGYTRFFENSSDPTYLLATNRQPMYALGAQWWLPVDAWFRRGWKMSLKAGGTYAAVGRDLAVLPSLEFTTETGWTAEAGVAVFSSFDDNRATIGDVLDWNDAAFARLERRW